MALYPPILKKDTVFIDVPVVIPPVDIDTALPVTKDTAALLKLIDHYASLLDSVAATKLKIEIREVIRKQKLFTDTAIAVIDGFTIKVWDDHGKLGFSLHKPAEVKNITVPAEVNSVTVEEKKSFWDKAKECFNWIFICIVILLSFYILIKRI